MVLIFKELGMLIERVVAHPITISLSSQVFIVTGRRQSAHAKLEYFPAWKGCRVFQIELDSWIKKKKGMSPRVVNVCKLSALVHVMHIDDEFALYGMGANHLISQMSF